MMELQTPRREVLRIGTLFFVVICLSMALFYYIARAYVINHAENEVRNLLMDQKGVHEYVQKIMHPALYEYQASGEIAETFYAPELFSSSFMVRNQHVFYNEERQRLGLPPVYYKMAAVNPRNPVNRADQMEAGLITRFNDNRQEVSYREIQEIDGNKYLYVALPFLANTEACLHCHGKRSDAPVQLQARYPGQGGFNENVGDIRAIISIRAPLQHELSTISIMVGSLVTGVLAMTGLFLFNARLRRLVSIKTRSLENEIDVRKKAEEEIALSFERFKSVLDSVDALVYVADMQSHELLFVNRYGRNNWGDVVGRTCWQVLQKDQTMPCTFCSNPQLIDKDNQSTGILIREMQNTVDNEWYECRDQAIRWTDGRLVRMEIATNITERRQMHQALAEEKELLAVTLRSIGDGVITTDTMGRVVLLNKVAESLTGWDSGEAVGKNLAEVLPIYDSTSGTSWKNPVEKIMATGRIIEQFHHVQLHTRNGTTKNIAFSGSPIRDKLSTTIGIVLVFRDVTDRIRTEQELTKVKKLESIGVLAGGIAHDFNNILAVILGNIDLALSDGKLPPNTESLLKQAEKASQRAQGLTQQLLTFAKGGEPVKESASLAEVITDSANFILRGDKAVCRYSIPDDLWLVDIDKGQISQVVQNIILNASQAMPDGGSIEVSCQNIDVGETIGLEHAGNGRFVKMTIRDHGIGIPANILDRIFDPYFSTKHKGSGLGLAITHSIINKHGGHLTVDSVPGQGTTFSVFLPASKHVFLPQPTKAESMASMPRARILLMDDDEQVRAMTERMLSRIGHEVVHASDGMEALECYRQRLDEGTPFDLVIMDLTIPGGMGGKDAVREVLALDPQARVIVASGYSSDPVMASYRDYGFVGAMAKPFNRRELHKQLAKALSQNSSLMADAPRKDTIN